MQKLECNTIYNMDCLDGLTLIENESVDLLLTDPPYNISQRTNFPAMGRQGVDFGEWDKGFNQQDWLKSACDKVRKGGSAVIFNDYKNIGEMKEVLESQGFVIKELLIWKKPNPMPRNRDRLYVTSIEVALWAVKGRGWTFNRQRETYENAIFESTGVNHKKRIHPTQKPTEILNEIIKIHSNEGDLILDCFIGSASTAISCLEVGKRDFIGFELDENYFKLANDRIDSYKRASVGSQ